MSKSRTSLCDETRKKLDEWRHQIGEKHVQFLPSDRDLISWAIEHLGVLTPRNIEEIRSKYFDKVDELQFILRQVKKERGNPDQLEALLSRVSFSGQGPKRRSSRARPTTEEGTTDGA